MRLDLYKNVHTDEILKAIGIKEEGIPRLRGVGIDDGKILIHTRTGGGNRDSYGTVEDVVEGEYGINEHIKDLKESRYYLDKYTDEERAKMIEQAEEQKRKVLETKEGTNEYLTSNKYYLYDEDDDFDCTYANFWFSIPEELTNSLLALENKEAKAVLGDAKVAIGLMFGEEEAKKQTQKNLDNLQEE